MTEPTTLGRGSWRLRQVPPDLAARYLAEGSWTDATLGRMVADGLGNLGHVGFRVRSQVRPWTGTFADVDRAARSLAAELAARGVGPGSVVVFQLPNWVEAGITFWAAAYLGAVVVPIVHFYGPKEVGYIVRATEPDVVVTGDRFGHADFLATWSEVLGATPGAALAGRGRHGGRRPAPGGDPVRLAARRRPDHRSGGGRSRRPDDHRLHLGHHARPQGGRALAPHDRLRDPPARPLLPHRRTAPDHRRPGRPLHRHAQRLPRATAARAGREPDRRVGSGRGAAHDARGGPGRRRRRHLLPHQPARPPRLHRRAPGAHALRRARRVDRAGGGDRAGDPARHQGLPLVRQHRAPVDHRVPARRPRGQAPHDRRPGAPGRRDAARGRRRDHQPRSRLLPRLHRPRRSRRRCSTPRAGTAPATWACSTTRATSRSPTGCPTSSSGVARTSAPKRSRSCSSASTPSPRPAWSPPPTSGSASGRRPWCACAPAPTRPDLSALCDHLRAEGLARQKWPESLHVVADFPRTPSGKVQKFRLRQQLRDGRL